MTDDRQAIENCITRWMEASSAGDTASVLSLMTDDVVFMTPDRAPFGKREFEEMSCTLQGMKIDGTSDIVEMEISGDTAWTRNFLKMKITLPDGKTVRRSGYTLTIFKKGEDGDWRIARDANLLGVEE